MLRGLSGIVLARAPSPRCEARPTWLRAPARQDRIPFKITLKKKKISPQRCTVFVCVTSELVLMTQSLCLKAIYLDDRYIDRTG